MSGGTVSGMRIYRVWFADGTAMLIAVDTEEEAKQFAIETALPGSGPIVEIEQLS